MYMLHFSWFIFNVVLMSCEKKTYLCNILHLHKITKDCEIKKIQYI